MEAACVGDRREVWDPGELGRPSRQRLAQRDLGPVEPRVPTGDGAVEIAGFADALLSSAVLSAATDADHDGRAEEKSDDDSVCALHL